MSRSGQRQWSTRGRLATGLSSAIVLATVALVALGATPSGYGPPSPAYTYTSDLKLEGEGTGSGTVTASPAGTDGDGLACTSAGGTESGDCSDTYVWTTTPPSVVLVAVAQPGSSFVAWEADGAVCGSNPSCALIVSSSSEVKARFELTGTGFLALSVSTAGSGAGSVTGDGIDCHRAGGSTSGDCAQTYSPGTQVVLTATPAAGSSFVGSWGGACATFGTAATCTVTMGAAQAVTAAFTLSGSGGSGACTITGTNAAEVLNGTRGDDVICGRGGNDTINGKGGNDILKGEKGADVVNGGKGADTMLGGKGADELNGGLGADSANGGPGADVCTAEVTISC